MRPGSADSAGVKPIADKSTSEKIPPFFKFRGHGRQKHPLFCDFAVRADSQKRTPFPRKLEHSWLPLKYSELGDRV